MAIAKAPLGNRQNCLEKRPDTLLKIAPRFSGEYPPVIWTVLQRRHDASASYTKTQSNNQCKVGCVSEGFCTVLTTSTGSEWPTACPCAAVMGRHRSLPYSRHKCASTPAATPPRTLSQRCGSAYPLGAPRILQRAGVRLPPVLAPVARWW